MEFPHTLVDPSHFATSPADVTALKLGFNFFSPPISSSLFSRGHPLLEQPSPRSSPNEFPPPLPRATSISDLDMVVIGLHRPVEKKGTESKIESLPARLYGSEMCEAGVQYCWRTGLFRIKQSMRQQTPVPCMLQSGIQQKSTSNVPGHYHHGFSFSCFSNLFTLRNDSTSIGSG